MQKLFFEYELELVQADVVIDWAVAKLTEGCESDTLVTIAGLSKKSEGDVTSLKGLLAKLLQEQQAFFAIPGEEAESIARGCLADRCRRYLQGSISPCGFCMVVDPFERVFNYPSWLCDLYNVCDGVDQTDSRQNTPYLAEEARNILKELKEPVHE